MHEYFVRDHINPFVTNALFPYPLKPSEKIALWTNGLMNALIDS